MIVATVFATFATMRGQVGFAGHQGFPFAWYWWTDFSANDIPDRGYHWGGLALDLFVWFLVIIASGFFVECIMQRVFGKYEAKG